MSDPQPPKKDEPEKSSKFHSTGTDEDDIEILKKYGRGPYTEKIKQSPCGIYLPMDSLVLICTDVGNYSFTFVSGQLHDTCVYGS